MISRVPDKYDYYTRKKRCRNLAGTVIMGDESMFSLAAVEFEFGQLLLDVASRGVQEGDNFIRSQRMMEYFSAVADVIDDPQKDPKITRLGGYMPFPRIIELARVAKK
jgi:hypothetical protein